MTMIVERSVVDIGNDSSTICGTSAKQFIRAETSNEDLELEKLLDYSDCESSDLPSSERSSGTSINIRSYKNDRISQYHSIQKLCTPTSSSLKSEEKHSESKNHCHNSFSFPNVKVKSEGYHYYPDGNSRDGRTTPCDDDDEQSPDEELSSKRQRLGDQDGNLYNYLGVNDNQYRPRRKQPQPKHCDDGATMRVSSYLTPKKSVSESYSEAHSDLQELQKSFNLFKQRYQSMFTNEIQADEEKQIFLENEDDSKKTDDQEYNEVNEVKPNRLETFIKLLKGEISQNIELLVDHVVRQFVQKNYQQLNIALQHQKLVHINSEDDHLYTQFKQTDVYESGRSCTNVSASEQIYPHSEKPINYSLQISSKKDEFSSSQENYKAYLRHLASSKTVYPLSNIQSMIPMFVPPFNPGYMFHNPNVYHPLFYHSTQKQQEVFKNESSGNTPVMSVPEQSEAIPLIVNSHSKKKRTKVTDSRFSPRMRFHHGESSEQNSQSYQPEAFQNCNLPEKRVLSYESKCFQKSLSSHNDYERRPFSKNQHSDEKDQDLYKSPFQAFIASSKNLQQSDILASIYKQGTSTLSINEDIQSHLGDKFSYQSEHVGKSNHRPRSVSADELKRDENSMKVIKELPRNRALCTTTSDTSFGDQLMTSTLTPMHLRKAKLMFFYVRYPSSSVLKTYFPDVFFNKNNTAQLIKWFSNFREFYYIQMEKFARQALGEGVVNALNLNVNRDSELYRILVLHYNRNNRIEVPENFRATVQATLREFFKAIQAERDQEQSWKKAIYKVIARLDDIIPEHFKRTNWMEELADS